MNTEDWQTGAVGPARHRTSSTTREYGKASEDASRSLDNPAKSNTDLTHSSTCWGPNPNYAGVSTDQARRLARPELMAIVEMG